MPKTEHHLGLPEPEQGEQIEDTYRDPDRSLGVGGKGQVRLSHGEDDLDVREALSHCPQCGSGKFTEYRKEQTTGS